MLKCVAKHSFCECCGLSGEIVVKKVCVWGREKLIGRMICRDLKLQYSNVKSLGHARMDAVELMIGVPFRHVSGPTFGFENPFCVADQITRSR